MDRIRYLQRYAWDCGLPGCDGLPHRGWPHKHARSAQRIDDNDHGTFFRLGRGGGKTRSAAEWMKKRLLREPGIRGLVVAPTFGAGRDICMEGESGLVTCLPPDSIQNWNRSLGELKLLNGSLVKLFGAHTKASADAIRGFQGSIAWMEEVATMIYGPMAYNNLMFALRLADPRVVFTGTPRNVPIVKMLSNKKSIRLVTGSTWDNKANLSPEFIEFLEETYVGTRLEQQEINGDILEDVVGALWKSEIISHVDEYPELIRVGVVIDPAGGHRVNNAETGVGAVGLGADGLVYVLADRSDHYTPEAWARVAIDLYDELGADFIGAEKNFGGDMVLSTLRSYDMAPKFVMINASRGKQLRAEPVVNLYERDKVKHVGYFGQLESQMTSWIPPGQMRVDENGIPEAIDPSNYSPDRIDWLVHGVSELVLKPRRARTRMSMGVEDG